MLGKPRVPTGDVCLTYMPHCHCQCVSCLCHGWVCVRERLVSADRQVFIQWRSISLASFTAASFTAASFTAMQFAKIVLKILINSDAFEKQ